MNRLYSFPQVTVAVAALIVVGLGYPVVASNPVPFRGTARVVVTGQEFVPPNTLKLTGVAGGVATHLGKFTRTETVSVTLPSFVLEGKVEFTAANGDKLCADVAGSFST